MAAIIEYDMTSLQNLLKKNVAEVSFIRRHDKPLWSGIRGAFVTTNYELLNSDIGYSFLNFKPPNGKGMSYNHRLYNLVVGWDLFRQEYRVFSVEGAYVKRFYDVSTDEDRINFWLNFRERASQLTNREKLIYMGYTGLRT